jgi:NAD+ synthase
MKTQSQSLQFNNPRRTVDRLTSFISKEAGRRGFDKVIVGISGGLDSSCVAYLCKRALGAENVIGVIMPYGRLSRQSVDDAKKIARILNIRTECIDISPMIDAYFTKEKNASYIRRGNKMARERMSILYDLSKRYHALVIGTSNKTERLLGYGTIYGDMACAINPIGALYKTQLRTIARYLKIPHYIIDKAPTAGLWHGQTDEAELGYRYKDIDRLLFFMVEERLTDKALIKKGFSKKFIQDIRKRIRGNSFKGRSPLIAKIGGGAR